MTDTPAPSRPRLPTPGVFPTDAAAPAAPARPSAPGVYIVEKNAFPPSIVGVATAVPAFVGYTAKAEFKGKPLNGVPFRLSSMAEFEAAFGGPPAPRFKIIARGDKDAPPIPDRRRPFNVNNEDYRIKRTDAHFLLHHAMRQFFANGGGPCWVVSVGDYTSDFNAATLSAGIDKLQDEAEPTLLVVPDTVRLAAAECADVQQAMLRHCGTVMKNRFAILDIPDGDQPLAAGNNPVDAFRAAIGSDNLAFGAAYYPWLNTDVVGAREIGFRNFLDPADLAASAAALVTLVDAGFAAAGEDAAARAKRKAVAVARDASGAGIDLDTFLARPIASEPTAEQVAADNLVNAWLAAASDAFKLLRAEALRQLNLLPPGGALAGLYAMVDGSRGVWKAPANISINGAISPAVALSDHEQQALNIDPMAGKSVNAIRSFIGVGVLVWGARTLDGNSADWRYVSVRRTMIFIEESCRLALKAMLFEPNDTATWTTVRSMLENFLTMVWKQGGLAGATPRDAFALEIGAGTTMTAGDVANGVLRVTVAVAITRPAEFVVVSLQQQQQPAP